MATKVLCLVGNKVSKLGLKIARKVCLLWLKEQEIRENARGNSETDFHC